MQQLLTPKEREVEKGGHQGTLAPQSGGAAGHVTRLSDTHGV